MRNIMMTAKHPKIFWFCESFSELYIMAITPTMTMITTHCSSVDIILRNNFYNPIDPPDEQDSPEKSQHVAEACPNLESLIDML